MCSLAHSCAKTALSSVLGLSLHMDGAKYIGISPLESPQALRSNFRLAVSSR